MLIFLKIKVDAKTNLKMDKESKNCVKMGLDPALVPPRHHVTLTHPFSKTLFPRTGGGPEGYSLPL